MIEKQILFIDMDLVLADFYKSPLFQKTDVIQHNPARMYEEYFFETLPVVEGALWAVRMLMPHYDIHVLTQPVKETHYSYSEKAAWIWKWFPELSANLHLTQQKELLSGEGRILIDDNHAKWSDKWVSQGGKFIHFKYEIDDARMNRQEWERIVDELTKF
jgi:5'(3')-deoxyribonucleotidase